MVQKITSLYSIETYDTHKINDYGLQVHSLIAERLKITSCACHLDSRDRYMDVAY